MINVDSGKDVGWTWQRRWVVVLVVCSLVAAYLVQPGSVSAATQYYVSTSGSDSNPGTSTQPWRTIQKAANTMVAGDTVIVRSGDYPERVQVSRSGSSGAQITFEAEGKVTMRGFTVRGNYVTIRGFDISNTPNAWADGQGIFVQANNCVIEDNYVHYATRGGIFVYAEPWEWGERTSSVVRNNKLYKNALVGIEVHGRNQLVEGNEIWGTIQHHPNWPSPSYSDADGIRFFGSGHTFRKNYIHDINFSDPENVNPHIDCFQTWGAEYQEAGRNIVFERNWCEVLESQTAYESGTAFMLAGASGLIIRSNVLQAAKHVNTGGGGNSNLTIVNNTMTSDLSFPTSNYPQGVALENCPNSTVRNNILYNLPGEVYKVTGTSTTGLSIGNNLAYRSDGKALQGSPYPGDLWGVAPGFANAGGGDYHLQTTSAAVDAGYNVGSTVPVDYDGIARPQGTAFDIGACECTGGQAPTSTPAPPTTTPVQSTSTPAPGGEVIVDNTSPGFSTAHGQDAWQIYTQAGGEHYGDSHAYNHLLGTGEDVATWSFSVPEPGRYAVHAWWWGGEWRPADVPYVIRHLTGSATVKVSQQINGGKWNQLGIYDFAGEGSVAVNDSATSGQDVVADAIRLVYVGPLPNTPAPTPRPTNTPAPQPTSTPVPSVPEVIVDDATYEFGVISSQDAWQIYTQAGGQHYGNTHHYNPRRGTGQDVATFYFAVPRSGRYAVYAWWWDGEWRANNVPYIIQHLNGVNTVKVNQRVNGGKWNLLGTYRFVSGGTVKVTDGATNGQDIVADAIRLVYVGP